MIQTKLRGFVTNWNIMSLFNYLQTYVENQNANLYASIILFWTMGIRTSRNWCFIINWNVDTRSLTVFTDADVSLTNCCLLQEIYKDRKKFSKAVFEVASSDLVNMGISVVSYTLKDIRDDEVINFSRDNSSKILMITPVFHWIINYPK